MVDSPVSLFCNPTTKPISPRKALPKAALVVAELVLFAVIGLSFWYQDLRYSLPTPQPKGWKPLPAGSPMHVVAGITSLPPSKPAIFNFYSSDCPCSRFNLDHVRQLAKAYGTQVRFFLVLEGGTKAEEAEAFKGLNLDAIPYCDFDGRLARDLGVYSTPQAVVIDSQHRLVYRGNYNVSRYCADSQSDFVRFSIESVVENRALPAGMHQAGPAYGCAISAVSGAWN